MKRLITILLLLFTFSSANAQRAGWWYGNAPGEAAAGPDTLTLTYWDDFILLHIANTGITETGSGVSEWQDRSGNGNHSTQTVDTNRPTVDGSGNVVFDGVDNYLTMTNYFSTVNDSAYTVFAVYEYSSSTAAQRIIERYVTGGTKFIILNGNVSGTETDVRVLLNDQDGNIDLPNIDTIAINNTQLTTVAASENTTIEVYVNSVLGVTDTPNGPWGTNAANTGQVLGANSSASTGFLNGKIKFMGIANRKFTPAEIATTESELNSFFTIY